MALASDRPLTYGGYHFAVLDSEEINALSCPGGMIFITRGMLRQVKTEDELAAILAHEVARVNHLDGAAAVERSRWIQVMSLLGTQTAQKYGGAELNELVSLFQGSAQDVVKTLLVNGYSRQEESEADESALTFLHRLGYNPYALPETMERMARTQQQGSTGGIFATHPGIRDRGSADTALISRNRWAKESNPARDQRFRHVFASLPGKKSGGRMGT
jgi:predicted Zn-dependent protease